MLRYSAINIPERWNDGHSHSGIHSSHYRPFLPLLEIPNSLIFCSILFLFADSFSIVDHFQFYLDIYGGYVCFVVSIIGIGLVTAVIGDVASHFGCTLGIKDTVTAIVFVALGTSVPGIYRIYLIFLPLFRTTITFFLCIYYFCVRFEYTCTACIFNVLASLSYFRELLIGIYSICGHFSSFFYPHGVDIQLNATVDNIISIGWQKERSSNKSSSGRKSDQFVLNAVVVYFNLQSIYLRCTFTIYVNRNALKLLMSLLKSFLSSWIDWMQESYQFIHFIPDAL